MTAAPIVSKLQNRRSLPGCAFPCPAQPLIHKPCKEKLHVLKNSASCPSPGGAGGPQAMETKGNPPSWLRKNNRKERTASCFLICLLSLCHLCPKEWRETESGSYRFRLLKAELPSPRGKETPLHRCEPVLSIPPAHTKATRGVTHRHCLPRHRYPGLTCCSLAYPGLPPSDFI